jgi:alkylhydroperoxidase/carboxymuconolactone decarboxylase family protein YurZ
MDHADAPERSFLDTGLDFSVEEFDPAEKAAMLAWYEEVHDVDDLDLAPFARFWIKNDPGGFKRLKRHLLTLEEEIDGAALPVAAGVLMYVFTYTATGNGKGSLYEIIAARALGATKAEILETLRLAALVGGPSGLNPLAEVGESYMDGWVEADDGDQAIGWPAGWAPDPAGFRSGLDAGTDELSATELDGLRDWYRRMEGEVPGHVELLARLHPRALKTHRLRYELAVQGGLPAQLIPLLELHLALHHGTAAPARRAVRAALALGVRRPQVVATLFWGAATRGDAALAAAVTAVEDLLADPA